MRPLARRTVSVTSTHACMWAMQMTFSESVFYYWSDKEWDACDRFREFATPVLNKQASPGMLEWSASDTQVGQQRLICLRVNGLKP